MTEGIIQKVIKNYISRLDNMPWDKKDLNDLQTELIEEIKKKVKQQRQYNESLPWLISQFALIGDNND